MSLGIQPMRTSFYSSLSLLVAVVAAALPLGIARAEVLCSADVSYTWVKSPPEQEKDDDDDDDPPPTGKPGQKTPPGGQTAAPAAAPAAAPDAPSQPKPSVVRFAGVQRAGYDEAGAKANLQVELNRQKVRASEQCKRDHESLGDCLATKLSARASILNSLGFSARNELEKALQKECSTQQGVCLSVDSSDPQCRTLSAGKGSDGAAADKKNQGKKPESKKK